MPSLSWLHLTDLHIGMDVQKSMLPNIKERFFEGLRRYYERYSREKWVRWDFIFFTGDLAQSGAKKEFEKVDEFIEELYDVLGELEPGWKPPLLAVPGNHDLEWQSDKEPTVQALRLWDKNVQDTFWGDRNSAHQQLIRKALGNYSTWWRKSKRRPKEGVVDGLLPGDFAYSTEVNGIKLGVLGLNTTFLQLTGENFEGKLAVSPLQFQEPCEGNGPKWAKRHDLRILLTHQPPSWLTKDSRGEFSTDIESRFEIQLCGHLHDPEYKVVAYGGGRERRTHQGTSLFGAEYITSGEDKWERRHGFSVGRIEINGGAASLKFYPRQARKQHDWDFGASEQYKLPDDSWTAELPIPLTKALVPAAASKPGAGESGATQLSLELKVDANGGIHLDGAETAISAQFDSVDRDIVQLFQNWLLDDRVRKPELKTLGKVLFRALFRPGIREVFLDRLAQAKISQPLRVHLRLEENKDLAKLPWEYMFYQDEGSNRVVDRGFYLSTKTDLHLSRRFTPAEKGPVLSGDKLRVLIVATDLSGTPSAVVGSPAPQLADAIGTEVAKGLTKEEAARWSLKNVKDPTREEFRTLLGDGEGYHVVHIIGRRLIQNKEQQIAWNNDECAINESDFATFFAQMKNRPPLLLLHLRCERRDALELQPATLPALLIDSGVPMVVTMQPGILDATAIQFCKDFYKGLVDFATSDQAVTQGRIAAQESSLGFGMPALYLSSDDTAVLQAAASIGGGDSKGPATPSIQATAKAEAGTLQGQPPPAGSADPSQRLKEGKAPAEGAAAAAVRAFGGKPSTASPDTVAGEAGEGAATIAPATRRTSDREVVLQAAAQAGGGPPTVVDKQQLRAGNGTPSAIPFNIIAAMKKAGLEEGKRQKDLSAEQVRNAILQLNFKSSIAEMKDILTTLVQESAPELCPVYEAMLEQLLKSSKP